MDIFCWRTCCGSAREKDDGEWMDFGSKRSKKPSITSIAVLMDDEYFLTASKHYKSITLHKTVEGGGTDVVRKFEGHSSGVTALAVLDKKGRFLSAGKVCQIISIMCFEFISNLLSMQYKG